MREYLYSDSYVAVIDIGSNSVRIVIYDGLRRVLMPMFNEKVLCGLAKNMEKTGNLDKEGVEAAKSAIARFVQLTRNMGVKDLKLFATSAVRDAKDGAAFVKSLEKKHNVKIEIFSGEQEAQYAAYGVISSVDNAEGVVLDLGGGSLEIIDVKKGKAGKGQSYPIGPLRLFREGADRAYYRGVIDSYITQFPIKRKLENKNLYLVGGAFRSMAKIHMDRINYPLKVLHDYRIPVGDFESTLKIISEMPDKISTKTLGIAKKREAFLPYAALVASRIIKYGKPENVIFSVGGVREGLLYAQLSEDQKSLDPLISGCEDFSIRMLRATNYGYELAKWVRPLFNELSKSEERLILASCLLGEISCYENTEYRAELAYKRILDSSLSGALHKERVFIAKAVYYRYSKTLNSTFSETMQSLLDEKELQVAKILGYAMRLARNITVSHPGLISTTSLEISGKKLILNLSASDISLIGEAMEKRLDQLALTMGLDGVIKIRRPKSV